MPIAVTPRRRSREEAESDESSAGASPDLIPSSQPDPTSTKRARLINGYASQNGTPLTNGHRSRSDGLQEETLRSRSTRRKHQPGSIVRVKLVNFVTYTEVEFHPGPSLNMVIGPNGTGKSTLVCAICLGLGWGPQHLGRAKEVSEFVKHGCQEAMIEIELAKDGKRFQRNVVIRCTIKREGNKTIFSVNNKPQGKKAVVELCRSLSIQIDNLCQFLPQDKVVEFAAMTPVDLLRSTQRAVASPEMIDMHEQLKEFRKKQKEVQSRTAADQDTLTNLQERQKGQEADVERLREREQVVKRVSMLETCRPVPAYRKARLEFSEGKEKRKVAERELAQVKKDVEPSLKALRAKEHYRGQIATAVEARKEKVAKAEKHVDATERKFSDLQDKANELVSQSTAEIKNGKALKMDVPRIENRIDGIKRQMEQQPAEFDVAAYNERIREKSRAAQNGNRQIKELKEQQAQWTRDGRNKAFRIQTANSDLDNLDSQAGKQISKLNSQSSDTAKMWEWIQQNQDKFEKPVLGPPLIECSVKDQKYVDLIESLVQRNTMLAFTVQTRNDFKTISTFSKQLGFRDVYFETMIGALEEFRPPVGRDELKRHGFDSWALDHMMGPDTVLAMLSYKVQLHQTGVCIPDTTPQQFQMLEDSPIQSWVTSKSSYRLTRRREYGGGARSTQVKPVRPAIVWTDQPVDLSAKRGIQENIRNWTEEIAALKVSIAEVQGKIEGYREAINKAEEEEKDISAEKAAKQKALGEFKVLPTRLASEEQKLAAAKASLASMRTRLADLSQEQDDIATQRAKIALDYAAAVETLCEYHNDLHEAEIMRIEATSDANVLKERNRTVTEQIQVLQREVDDSASQAKKASEEAHRLLNVVREILDSNAELKVFAETLPTLTVEEHEAEIESEKARLELMHEGNGGIIRDFELRQKKIDTLTARLEEIQSALTELDDKIKELRDQWEPELDRLVSKISDTFSTNMEQISCAGEVGVFKDEDFDQWAIHIRVKFREHEPLTTLDSHRQSGGERAVSTIFYLMSLQTLTKSPFRVVDEINQGMDPRNERLVHKRMVGIACGKGDGSIPTNGNTIRTDDNDDNADDDDIGETETDGGSQYFLITPKLLSNLSYERGMRVLCIASGEFMPEDRSRVDFGKALDRMRGLRAEWGTAAA